MTNKQIVGYEHPAGGCYSETVVVFSDGTKATVDCQYAVVLPHGKHAENCDQINKMGGRCTCGKLDGIDIPALIADARINGKLGYAPAKPIIRTDLDKALLAEAAQATPACPHCGTYCYGDCQANK